MTLQKILIASAACLLSFTVQSAAWASYSADTHDGDDQATTGWHDAGWTETEADTQTFTQASLSTFTTNSFFGGYYWLWHAHWCQRYPQFCRRLRGQEPPAVPEPAALALLLVGGAITLGCAYQRHRTVVRA